jgi:hypothetical protein
MTAAEPRFRVGQRVQFCEQLHGQIGTVKEVRFSATSFSYLVKVDGQLVRALESWLVEAPKE